MASECAKNQMARALFKNQLCFVGRQLYLRERMKQHILVVDDEPPIRELLASYFKKHGYDVTTAADAVETMRLADEVPLHLVILDVLLPDTDGLEILEQLKGAHPNLPIIIMTGIGFDEELLQEAIQKGASGYVSKTLPLDQLLMEVHRTLKFKGAH
jgi:two-component system, NtrC family, nitrogen regulation response regulator NtrX